MKQNIATDIEQGKRLLACGVKPETADMCYSSGALSLMEYRYEIKDRDSRRESYDVIPAWSLSALLALLPMEANDTGLQTIFQLSSYPDEKKWTAEYYDFYMDKHLYEEVDNSPIEACVKTIEWLTANGYSLNNIEQ